MSRLMVAMTFVPSSCDFGTYGHERLWDEVPERWKATSAAFFVLFRHFRGRPKATSKPTC